MRPLTALVAAGIVAIPWYVWVHLRTGGDWTYEFFVTHNVSRAMNTMEGHRGNVLFYPAALLVGFFPWSILWLPIAMESVRQIRTAAPRSAASLFALCWVGVYVGLFSLAKTKLPSYVTPCYPALAILSGAFIDRWITGQLQLTAPLRRVSFGSLILIGAAVTVGLPILFHQVVPGEEILGVAGLIPLLGGIACLGFAERGQNLAAARMTAATAMLFLTMLFAVVTVHVDRHRHLEDLVAAVYNGDSPETVEVASLSSLEPSWVFYCRQPIHEFVETRSAVQFLAENGNNGKRRVLVTTAKKLQKNQQLIPLDDYLQQRIPYFLEHNEIVVLQPRLLQTVRGESIPTH